MEIASSGTGGKRDACMQSEVRRAQIGSNGQISRARKCARRPVDLIYAALEYEAAFVLVTVLFTCAAAEATVAVVGLGLVREGVSACNTMQSFLALLSESAMMRQNSSQGWALIIVQGWTCCSLGTSVGTSHLSPHLLCKYQIRGQGRRS